MNKITIQGRIAKDIELGHSQSGNAYARFTVAVDRRGRKDEDRKTDFFDCVAFSGTAEFIHKYFLKGDGILLSGRMESNQWTDKDGNKRLSWSVSIDDVEFPLGKSKNAQAVAEEPKNSFERASQAYSAPTSSAEYASGNYSRADAKAEPQYYSNQVTWNQATDDGDLPF